MRWTEPEQPAFGSERNREWFALLPVTIGKETRWLEVVRVKEKVRRLWSGEKVVRTEWFMAEFLEDEEVE